MNNAKILFTSDFDKGLDEIKTFRSANQRFSTVVTDRIINGIIDTANNLAFMPERNPIAAKNIRKAQYHDKPSGARYSIFYNYDKDTDTIHVQDVADGVTQRASVLLGYSVNEDGAATSPTANYSSAFLEQMQGLTPKSASESGTSSVKKAENVNE